MTRASLVFGGLSILIACGDDPNVDDNLAATAAARARCMTAANHAVAAAVARRIELDTSQVAPVVERELIAMCIEDRWPEIVLACFETSGDRCRTQLTVEQRARYATTMMQLVAPHTAAAKP